jgi:hypothetical protein
MYRGIVMRRILIRSSSGARNIAMTRVHQIKREDMLSPK